MTRTISPTAARASFQTWGHRGAAVSHVTGDGTVRYDPADPDRETPIAALCARIERETGTHARARHDGDNVTRSGAVLSSLYEITLTRPVPRRLGGGHTVLGALWASVSLIETHPTAAEITALRIEAGTAGDTRLVETCRRAEEGSRRARATVARILAAAARRG